VLELLEFARGRLDASPPAVERLGKELRLPFGGRVFSGHSLEVWRGGIGPRQQIIDAGVEMAGDDAAQHVREISLRIHPAQFAGLDQ
jgi:hypothetical protein